jgi:hypothetical protein
MCKDLNSWKSHCAWVPYRGMKHSLQHFSTSWICLIVQRWIRHHLPMSAPRDSSSSTNSSWPPAQANVRAVSWLLSVSESTSMQEKGACGHCVPGYGVLEGYCPTPGHRISNYSPFVLINILRRIISILTLTFRTGFNHIWTYILQKYSEIHPGESWASRFIVT